MKRTHILYLLFSVIALSSCAKKDIMRVDNEENLCGVVSEDSFEFLVSDTKAPVPVTSLTSFYASATTGGDNSQKLDWSNREFTKNADGIYVAQNVYWPLEDRGNHIYASNVTMEHNTYSEQIHVNSIDTDIVCAYIKTPEYRKKNYLTFKHILARVSTVNIDNLSDLLNVKVTLKAGYKVKGTYSIATDAWSDLTSASDDLPLATNGSDNNIWLIPGDCTISISCQDKAGNSLNREFHKTLTGGSVNNITVNVESDYVIDVTTENVSEDYYKPVDTKGVKDYGVSVLLHSAPDCSDEGVAEKTVGYAAGYAYLSYDAWHYEFLQDELYHREGYVTVYKYKNGSQQKSAPVWTSDVSKGQYRQRPQTEANKVSDRSQSAPTCDVSWYNMSTGAYQTNGGAQRTATVTLTHPSLSSVLASARLVQTQGDFDKITVTIDWSGCESDYIPADGNISGAKPKLVVKGERTYSPETPAENISLTSGDLVISGFQAKDGASASPAPSLDKTTGEISVGANTHKNGSEYLINEWTLDVKYKDFEKQTVQIFQNKKVSVDIGDEDTDNPGGIHYDDDGNIDVDVDIDNPETGGDIHI